MNEPDWTTHITSGPAWRRFGLMVIFIPILACVGFFIAFTALFQFFNVLAQGEPNPHLAANSRDMGRYAGDIIDFLTYNSEKRPFPFTDRTADRESGPEKPQPATPEKKTPARKKTATRRTKRTSQSTKKTATRKNTTTTQSRESPPAEPAAKPQDADEPSE